MAMTEQRQSELYVKIAGVLMVLLLVYGALSLVGVIR